MPAVLISPDRKVILQDISWRTYEGLLADTQDHARRRLTYDQGTLEIMSPTAEHEEINRTIALLIEVVAEETGIDIRNLGSTTFKREDLMKGFEPDSCFYIQSLEQVAGKTTIDLTEDPPPDLIVEVDIASGSLDKLPVYARLGVTEVWRYDGGSLTILLLEESVPSADVAGYRRAERSLALNRMSTALADSLIEYSKTMRRRAWLAKVRASIQGQRRI
jgi:Uma2 family endonuclease